MGNNEIILNRYFEWLLDRMNYQTPNHRCYSKLMQFLFDKAFLWVIDHDSNRVGDGLALRGEFANEEGIIFDPDLDCSVLEVLAALSIRCDDNIMGDPEINKESKLFWIMLDNLNLTYQDDYGFDADICKDIVEKWMNRRIRPNGTGGLFPLKFPKRDQKPLEIWVQMQDYLAENFEGYDEW